MINPISAFVSGGRPLLGFKAAGINVYAPFCPSDLLLANVMDQPEASQADPKLHIRLGEGRSSPDPLVINSCNCC